MERLLGRSAAHIKFIHSKVCMQANSATCKEGILWRDILRGVYAMLISEILGSDDCVYKAGTIQGLIGVSVQCEI
jgi:hypothetical protein